MVKIFHMSLQSLLLHCPSLFILVVMKMDSSHPTGTICGVHFAGELFNKTGLWATKRSEPSYRLRVRAAPALEVVETRNLILFVKLLEIG